MLPGVYKLFHLQHNDGKSSERLVGRFMIDNNQFHTLECHEGLLSDSLPDGEMDENHLKVLNGLKNSGYYKLVNEDDVNQGQHLDMIPDMSLGPTEPDQEFMISNILANEPQRLEMYRFQRYFRPALNFQMKN